MKLRFALPVALSLLAACGDDTTPARDTSASSDAADGLDAASPSDALLPDATAPSDATDPSDVADTADVPLPEPLPREVFAFRATPGQTISEGPFPNDGLIGPDGLVKLAPLAEDDRFSALSKPELLARTDTQIAARSGFGFVSSVFFPMQAEPDLASFATAVHYIALSGPEEGRVFPGMASWFAPARYLTVFPAWGHYLVPGSTYAVVIDVGVRTRGGLLIEPPDAFSALVAAEVVDPTAELTESRRAFAKLRDWLATRDEAAVVGTVFTTEPTMPWFGKLLEAADAFTLEPPTREVAYTTAGEPVVAPEIGADDLDGYFGVPTAPFAFTPTPWDGTRGSAAALNGGARYTGGSFRGRIGRVINGSIVVPGFGSKLLPSGEVVASPILWEDGRPVARVREMVPFTVFLCEDHLVGGLPDPNRDVPFAIFTHGGTALRSGALGFAVANCAAGYATVALDLPFHGGRQDIRRLGDEGDLVVPRRVDAENVFTGLTASDPDFVPDRIGDNGPSTTTVGSLFALASIFDPDVLEANLIAIAVEAHVLVRYLKDPAMMSALLGTKVDTRHLVMQSLSFGTSFTTALMAASDDFAGAIQSVGSGGMMTLNLPMAPNNAALASGIIFSLLGVKSTIAELTEGAYRDPMLALLQWLSQRGDPQGYAPFVLRHREDGHALHVFGSGDSWDETLFSPAQLGFNNAWGLPVFTSGGEWTLDASIPGAATIEATPWAPGLSGNLTYEGRTQSAGYFYFGASCHAQVVTPICESSWQPPYPPATPRETPLVSPSPICALQSPVIGFLGALLRDEAPEIGRPEGTCEDLYAP